jgi:hypothetical protein
MAAYTVAATAVTLQMPPKWVDNVLSHHRLPGVAQARQGVTRRVTREAILVLDVALRLSRSLAVPMNRALDLATTLTRAGKPAVALSGGVTIAIDLAAIQTDLTSRLAHAVEVAPSPPRGRPATPTKTTRQ